MKGVNIMDFRNRKSATNKSTSKSTSKRTIKTNKTFVKLAEVEGALQIEDGEMWMKSSKDEAWAPGVTINIDENNVISDWVRKITLRNVELTVEENERGYPELVISGQSNTDDAGLP
jgi:hypothetical protein